MVVHFISWRPFSLPKKKRGRQKKDCGEIRILSLHGELSQSKPEGGEGEEEGEKEEEEDEEEEKKNEKEKGKQHTSKATKKGEGS